MKKIILVVLFLLVSGVVHGRDPLLQDKDFYSIGEIGETLPLYNKYDGSGTIYDFARIIGALDTASRVCVPKADANCNLYVSITGSGGAIDTGAMDPGDDPLITDTLIGTYSMSGMYGIYVPDGAVAGGEMFAGISAILEAPDDIDYVTTPNSHLDYILSVVGLNYGYDASAGDWDRIHADTVGGGEAIETAATGLVTKSANYVFDVSDSTFEAQQADAVDTDGIVTTSQATYSSSFNLYYDETASDWNRIRGIESHADAMAVSTDGVVTASVLYGFNGATLDMLRLGASKELQVTDIATRPGEDAANDLRKVSKVDVGTYSPAKTTTTGIVGSAVVVLASTEVLDLPSFCVYLQNDDDADPFTDADIFVSPDGTAWVDLGWVSCDTLAFGEICVYCVSGNAYRYVKAEVTGGAANDVDVDAWITGNKG